MKYPNKMRPVRIGQYTQKIVRPVFKVRGLMEGKIITHWTQIVGEKFAGLAIPEKIAFPKSKKSEGTLYLSVTSSGALLLQYAQDLILEQINIFFGYKALSKLKMTHDFIPFEESSLPKVIFPLSPENQDWIEEQVESIKDSELKACLIKLGEAVCR
ncbi:MAG: DUF721 domain-containing protein [Proteobacteria bacterium]|nr:DUF721 domain-containing protein [Pseudomonadota bacterium]